MMFDFSAECYDKKIIILNLYELAPLFCRAFPYAKKYLLLRASFVNFGFGIPYII